MKFGVWVFFLRVVVVGVVKDVVVIRVRVVSDVENFMGSFKV